jgi:hypothetical protein
MQRWSHVCQAVRRARNEFKFLIIYLHSSLHSNTPAFCRHVAHYHQSLPQVTSR